MIAQISIGDNVLDFAEGSFAVESSFAAGKSSDSQQPSETICTRENDSLTPVDAQDLSGADAVVAAFESFCIQDLFMPKDEGAKDIIKVDDIVKSSSLCDDQTKDTLEANNSVESFILKDDEENTVMKIDGAFETKGPDMTSLSPCRQGSFKNKFDQASHNKRPVRNCRKKANEKVLFDLSSLQVIRRRRSSLCKQARSTVWGLMSSIESLSEHNGGLDVIPDATKRSRRRRGVQGNGKREKNRTARSSEKLKQEGHTPTGRISLKVKFGKQTVSAMSIIPEIGDNKEVKDCRSKNHFCELPKDAKGLLEEEVPDGVQFQFTDGNSEKASGMHLSFKDSSGNLDRNTADDLCDSPFYEEVDKVGSIDNVVLDSGTSPDSEVINIVPDSQIIRKDSEELPHVLLPSNGFAVSGNVRGLSLPWPGSEPERRKDELHETDDCCLKGETPNRGNLNKVQEFAKLGQRENMGDGSYSSDTSTSTSTGNASVHASTMKVFYGEPLPSSARVEFGNCCRASNVETGNEVNLSPTLDEQRESTESLLSQRLLPCSKGQKLEKHSRARKVTKSKSGTSNLSSRGEKASKKKGNQDKSAQKSKTKETGDQILQEVENLPKTGNHTLFGIGETGKKNISLKGDIFINSTVAGEVAKECTPPRNAWVSCDDCHKWRRIPAALADKIEETNCRWFCKDNKDREFANCSIPQEKSNAEINAELEISDASCEEDVCDVRLTSYKPRQNQSRVSESSWTLIKSNLFLHRRRKTQSIDEIMVCGCKQPLDGRMGCGAKCLNRMLNIECISGTCPSGESCSNQQFQRRKYAKLKSFKCGKKGYGLQLLEEVSEGQFLIEYVGEVLDMHAYEARQRDYAVKGHKHFYFMTLNGSEVIDACAKGNLGRFINHSCDPNCRTEKWMVNGEVCIGIFALRDIKKGEEVTFDYNYVRVFGAAAKKCVCGSSQCRGYIGGDPLNSDIIVQGDSDEEYPEPVMVCEDDEMDQNTYSVTPMTSSLKEKEVRISKESCKQVDEISGTLCNSGQAEITSDKQTQEMFFRDKVEIDSSAAAGCSDITKESREPINKSASVPLKIKISLENECSVGQHSPSIQSGDGTSRDVFAASKEFLATEKDKKNSLALNQGSDSVSLDTEPEKSLPDILDAKKKLKPSGGENEVVFSKSRPRTKISGKLFSDKKRKSKTDAVNVKKPLEIDYSLHVVPLKPKRLLEDPSTGRFEAGRFKAVQEKLNELLDSDGGISKRKDASRGYLKLLLLTAASGDSGNGEAIQSNRDLSMILDALLKTKSRTVLVDIINKNGLQMLHNIMKRYRKEFIKIPILRKLLKVLEYLATREILTSEHINGGPRCPGVESFRDSILTLTEHKDKQVHQIARNFRDRWIPRCFRKYGSIDRDDCRMEFHRGPSHDKFPASHNNLSDQSAKTPETLDCGTKSVAASSTIDAIKLEGSAPRNTRKRKSRWDQPYKGRPDLIAETDMAGDGVNSVDEDAPPGFSSPRNGPMPSSDSPSSAIDHQKERSSHRKYPSQVAMGHSQQRFISRLSVAYGVPISIVQQFGTQQSETSESWIVAPGMPFQPFPPLPQYPRDQSKCTSSQVAQKAEQSLHSHATPDSSQNPPSTTAVAVPDLETPGVINQFDFQRARGHNNLGRKYFRQQKWNNSKLAPPWVRMRNGWGLSGTNPRNGMYPPGFGSGLNEFKNSYNSQDIGPGVQNGNTFHQHPQQQNWN